MRKLFLFIILLSFSFATSCSQSSLNNSTLNIGIEGNPTNLDPGYATDAYSTQILRLCFEGLIRFDRNGDTVPQLAERFYIKDNKTIEFILKKGITFQNGEPFTSEDVYATLYRIINSDTYSPYTEALSHIEQVVIQGPYRLLIRLKEPYEPIFSALTIGILPHKLAGEKHLSIEELIGTGPYRLEKYSQSRYIELKAYQHYWRGSPHIKRIIFRIIPDDLTRILELEKGSIDLLVNAVPPDAVNTLKKNEHIRIITGSGNDYEYLGFNMRDPILKIKSVREAIAYAINRQAIIKYVLFDQAEPANSILPPWNYAYNPDVKQYNYDPVKARYLLDHAGFALKNGYRFSLDFKTSNNPLSIRVAQAIAYQLEQIGIKVHLRSYEWATFYSDIRHGNFQVYTLRWVGVMDPDILYYAFDSHSFPPYGANRGYYINPEVDQLIEQARQTLNIKQALPLYRRVQSIVAQDLPYISLWYMKDITAMQKRLKGFEPFPGGGYEGINNAYLVNPKNAFAK
ncbi:MAG: ABC transporter substrate-binding protein [bacterium]